MWVQTGPLIIDQVLTTAYAQVYPSGLTITIPFAGVWEVSYQARSVVNSGAANTNYWASTILYKGQSPTDGSQALAGGGPANLILQATAGQTVLAAFDANDVVSLYARGIGSQGNNASILSNTDGRITIAAHWVSAV
ncbi:hypothetical protein SAMN04489712_13027 [Thermomonospora echinospora]|uniref:Uncharacterized protein n=1 Tax=Thermomonospora echinospora TaxID=1992 RepID=A0A1H6E3W9_9ACTN|nr:hypothetical protein [Thermomonospora echinospora]SEG91706.1 hypothetical protein SAMN04489712_13027 [Thermomonospora echinospora]